MKDYIEREAACELLAMALDDDWEPKYAADRMNNIPAADVRPVVRGEWEVKGQDIYCSVCGEESGYNPFGASTFSHFCPNCGADMRGDDK